MCDFILVPQRSSSETHKPNSHAAATLWHCDNVQRNRHHYPFHMRALGGDACASLQCGIRPYLYINTLVHLGSTVSVRHIGYLISMIDLTSCSTQACKYAVITFDDLVDDLENWRHLYIAGRLQKPVTAINKLKLLK
eukprot:Selendium_serpulae@DN3896_c0_g1_i1.p1